MYTYEFVRNEKRETVLFEMRIGRPKLTLKEDLRI
jgi:hypothetical protein